MAFALTGARIFDGSHMLEGHAVVIESGRILGVPAREGPRNRHRTPRR